MRVAVYARYSSDKQKDSSIDQQVDTCARYAERAGWTITKQYEDRAISGSQGEEGRPGYKSMLADLKTKAFDILLIDDFSRLSRDSEECEKTRRRILFHGARLIAVSDGIDTNQKAHKLQVRAKGMTNEVFLDQLKEQIKRGMRDQAEQGFWNGGRVYGYKLVPVLDHTKQDCYGQPVKVGTRLEIDPEQAQWVRWIFEQYANGQSALKIVTELNRLNVPPPAAGYKKRRFPGTPGWNFLALHGELARGTGLLNNRLYEGMAVWNRSHRERDPDTGRQVNRWRAKNEWIEKPMPHLRIIDEALWTQAHTRRVAVSESVMALRASATCRVTSAGRRPKYLFSGLLSCGVCHKPFTICESTKYGCSTVSTQGVYRCTNTLRVERTLLEALLLEPIQSGLFTQEGYELFRSTFLEELAIQRQALSLNQGKTQTRLAAVEQEIAHIMTAIRAGIITPSTKQALEQAEAERERLQSTASDLEGVPNGQRGKHILTPFLPDLKLWFKQAVGNLATVGPDVVDEARGILKDLVGGSIVLKPTTTTKGKALAAILRPDYGGLLKRLAPKIILVAVTPHCNYFGQERAVLLQRVA